MVVRAATTPLAAATFPGEAPSLLVVARVVCLAAPSTAVAYLVYFRLLASVGPTKTLTVTFLAPVFGLLFGVVAPGRAGGGRDARRAGHHLQGAGGLRTGGLERSFEEFARSRTEQGEDAHRSAAEINEKYDSEFVGPPL